MLLAQAIQQDLSVRRIGDDTDLQELAHPWNILAGDSPFRRFEWLEAWWRCYREPGMELFVAAVHDLEGELIGLAPWYVRSTALRGRVVSFLGSGQVCSDYLTVLAAPDHEAAVAGKLADWLAGEAREAWDLIELDGVEREDPMVARLLEEFAARGHLVHRRERIGAWRLELPGDWESYTAALSKSRRSGVRKLEKRYFQTGRAVLRTAEDGQDVARGLQILRELHQKRRKSLGDPGCFASQRFSDFLHLVAPRLHALGRLRLRWIELDGQPVATEFDVLSGETAYYYQSGMDPDAAQHKPGWLMQMSALRQAIEAGLGRFDFLRGDEPYKSSWGAERIGLDEIRIVARRRSACIRHRVWAAGVRARQWRNRAIASVKQRRTHEAPPSGLPVEAGEDS